MPKIKINLFWNILQYFRKHFIKLLFVGLLFLIIYLLLDFYGPKNIYLKTDHISGLPCLRAQDLTVQDYDSKGDLWATRGMLIYKLEMHDNKFIRVARVPTGFSILWLNNFSLMRRYTHRIECIEIIVSEKRGICALSAGYMWYRPVNGKKFKKTLKLPNFGIGIGRGIMSTGITNANDSIIFFGEYFANPKKTNVRIFKSNNSGMTWEIAYDFQPDKIRHIHALQQDPYTDRMWICTGDINRESIIGWSTDNYKSIVPLGKGSQIWRACQLVFTEGAVYWGTDTGNELAGIYRWDKESMELTKLVNSNGAIFFGTRLAKGTIVMSTDREGIPIEKDDRTRLFIISNDDKITIIECGTWNYKKKGFRSSFARLRFQRGQGSNSLAITFLNQKEIPDGDLIILSEDTLIKVSK